MEVAGDESGLTLAAAQVATQAAEHVSEVARALAAESVGLNVVVEHLGGVELGAVAGQVVQLDQLRVSGDPVAHDPSAVGWVPVHDEHDLLALGLVAEAFEEVQEDRSGEALLKDPEAQRAGVAHGGDHVGPKALTCALDDGGATY